MGQDWITLPPFGAGQRIGLFGGSFNPAHEGHYHVAMTALKSLQLDWLWVIVSPGNPLKQEAPQSLAKRKEQTEKLITHPRIRVVSIEEQLGSPYTFDLISYLKKRARNAHFTWVMGADNLQQFHLWQNWQRLAEALPIAVVTRDKGRFAMLNSVMAQRYDKNRTSEREGSRLPFLSPPAWVFLGGKRILLSSSQLRYRPGH